MKLWIYRAPAEPTGEWYMCYWHKDPGWKWNKHPPIWEHPPLTKVRMLPLLPEALKDFFGLTDTDIRDDMLVEWEVHGNKTEFDPTWGYGCVFLCRRKIRYGRDEKTQNAKDLWDEYMLPDEDPTQVTFSIGGARWMRKALLYLLRKEAAREAKE